MMKYFIALQFIQHLFVFIPRKSFREWRVNLSNVDVLESTLLSKLFAEQGLKIRIRKEMRAKK